MLDSILQWISDNTPGFCQIGWHFCRFKNLYLIRRTDGVWFNTCAKCDQDKLHWGK